MKSKNQNLLIAFCAAFSAAALLVGCNNSNTTPENSTAANEGTNGAMTNAENSGVNVRDRDTNNLTPGDQGNSPGDRAITQKIRQMVVSSTNDYSMTAKNIKIITVDGKVTLRGPVKTDMEKSGIGEIATGVAGAGNVDNELDVKAVTNP